MHPLPEVRFDYFLIHRCFTGTFGSQSQTFAILFRFWTIPVIILNCKKKKKIPCCLLVNDVLSTLRNELILGVFMWLFHTSFAVMLGLFLDEHYHLE